MTLFDRVRESIHVGKGVFEADQVQYEQKGQAFEAQGQDEGKR